MTPFLPDSVCQIDPRNGELIVYNSTRARRPTIQETPMGYQRLTKSPV